MEEQAEPKSSGVGRGLAIAGMVCGLAAPVLPTAVLPLIIGSLGILLGVISLLTGGGRLGAVAVVISAGGIVAGLIISALAAAA